MNSRTAALRGRLAVRKGIMGACSAVAVVLSAQVARAAEIPVLDWTPRSDWVSVKGLGAAGDGIADDTAAIQSGLSAAKNGSVIYFPAGRYRVTETLSLAGPLTGVLVIGHGRDTTLVWDGAPDGHILTVNGVAHSRYVGLSFEGGGRAAVGFRHFSMDRFETEVWHQHLAFRNFTAAGIEAAPGDRYALAETTYENCLFEKCQRGVSLVSFNDYNHTFDGCEFRQCGTGIYCIHGNCYVRNTHFEGSTVVDIRASPEHASSVRRCSSQGSHRFLSFASGVSPMTIQDCHVDGWQAADGAVQLFGAPVTLFDCVFTNPPNDDPPVRVLWDAQRLIHSENRAPGSSSVFQAVPMALLYQVPPGQRRGSLQSATQRFLHETASVPGRVFDAKVDFGAMGNGVQDDTAAIQACINAARDHGKGAIAYMPSGRYKITDTLWIRGKEYIVGGTGFNTQLAWNGAESGTMVRIEDPDHVILEHLMVGGEATNNAVDILQTHSGGPSHMTYDGVLVYGMYRKDPFRKGLRLKGLGAQAVVVMNGVQGNLRFIESSEATIVAGTSYEGSITVEGTEAGRDGLLGFLTRLATITTHGLYLRDNHSIVMSDFYVEQADNGFVFEGRPGLPPGRATIQGSKLHFTPNPANPEEGTAITIRDYAGQIFMGHQQHYVEPTEVRIVQSGTSPVELFLHSCFYYSTRHLLEVAPSFKLRMLGNSVAQPVPGDAGYTAADIEATTALENLPQALDDLRRLGVADLVLNHLGADADSDGDGSANFEEMRMGTNPFDPASAPTVGSVGENAPIGTAVALVSPREDHGSNPLRFALRTDESAGALAISADTGILTVAKSAGLDFEALGGSATVTPELLLWVEIADTLQPERTESVPVIVMILDVNEAPVLSGGSATIPESMALGSEVFQVGIDDPDRLQSHSWAIVSGNQGGTFGIDDRGSIMLAAAPDPAVMARHELGIVAIDSGEPPRPGTATVIIEIDAKPVAEERSFAVLTTDGGWIDLRGSDPEVPPSQLQYVLSGLPAKGSLEGAGPSYHYTPAPGELGVDTFSYVVCDGVQESQPANVSIAILLPPIDRWKARQFGAQAANPAVAGDAADPDGDSINNLFEYAYGLEPLVADGASSTCHRGPAIEARDGNIALIYRRNLRAIDLLFRVEQRASLALAESWQRARVEATEMSRIGDVELIRAQVLDPPPQRGFLRLRVERSGK